MGISLAFGTCGESNESKGNTHREPNEIKGNTHPKNMSPLFLRGQALGALGGHYDNTAALVTQSRAPEVENLDRPAAEAKLLAAGDGLFLLRAKGEDEAAFVLSFMHGGKFVHRLYAPRPVQHHLNGGQADIARPSARTIHPHVGPAYVQMGGQNIEERKYPPDSYHRIFPRDDAQVQGALG